MDRDIGGRVEIGEILVGQQRRVLVVEQFSTGELAVGDILMLDAGDKIVADCLLFDHQGIVLDEASLTGESEPIKKSPELDPWIRSGTQVGGLDQGLGCRF